MTNLHHTNGLDADIWAPEVLEPLAARDEFDAAVWAHEFISAVKGDAPEIPRDFDTMHAWFASAIMAGFDRGRQEGVTNDHLQYICDALGEARELGTFDHWNTKARKGLDDAHKALRCLEQETRP